VPCTSPPERTVHGPEPIEDVVQGNAGEAERWLGNGMRRCIMLIHF